MNTVETRPSSHLDCGEQPVYVLLVEDNPVALHLIENMVTEAGLLFKSAVDGESAYTLATSHSFDLILTDIGLPGISGYELTAAIRQWEKMNQKKSIPIIGITAKIRDKTDVEYLHVGMNRLLIKPIHVKMIQKIIKQYVPTKLLLTSES